MQQLLAFIAVFSASIVTLIWSAIGVLCVSLNRRSGYFFNRTFGRLWCFFLGIQLKVEGWENIAKGQGLIIAPNHESMFDIFILASLEMDFVWISKMQIGKIPLVGTLMRVMGCYIVRRDGSEHDLFVMKNVEEGLKRGISVVVFPEGTRSRTGDLLLFKKGAFRIAQNAQVPLLPVALCGTFKIAPPKRLPKKLGHRVLIRIGKPMDIPRNVELTPYIDKFRQVLLSLRDY